MSGDSNSHGKAPPEGIRAAFKEALLRKIERQGEVFPLSYGQRALWFLQESAPESAAYNLVYVARLLGEVEAEELKSLFAELVKRHRQLRTTYRVIDGEPVQETAAEGELRIEVIDAGGASEEELVGRIMRQAREAMDLGKGPVFRVLVYERSDGEKVLGLIAHHIAVDYWSLVELESQIKEWLRDGKWAPKAEKSWTDVGYEEYVRWQRELVAGEEGTRQWEYWRRELDGELPALNLPTDRARGGRKTFEGEWREDDLEAGVAQGLREVGRRAEATLYMVMLGAWEALLQRYSGQKETLVGTPVAGRVRAEFEKAVGMMANLVVMRGDGRGDPNYVEYLGDVKRRVLGGLENQDYPFALLVERLKPEREANRSPLCDVTFAWEKPQRRFETARGNERPGFDFKRLALRQMGSPYDVTLVVFEEEGDLRLCFQYNTDLFDGVAIERLAEHYGCLLRSIVANPAERLSQLTILPFTERRQLLCDWNRTDAPSAGVDLIHERVSRQAALTPGRIAIEFENENLSYGELEHRVERLSRLLIRSGIGPDSLVAICLDRSPELVIAMLAVLRAGGAYVPLDSTYPKDFTAAILIDSRAALILTVTEYATTFKDSGVMSVCLDEEWNEAVVECGGLYPSPAVPDNLAYIIYTSGSTGRPKGAMITHGAIKNHMDWMAETWPLTESDVILQKTPACFDASVWEFYASLMSGARLVLARPGGHRDAHYLVQALIERQVTILQLVPSLLPLLLQEPDFSQCRSLRRVYCGGEVLPTELVENFYDASAAELFNLYGPTETTIDVTSFACRRGSAFQSAFIGRPITNTQTYVLDEWLSPEPIGVVGELCVGGAALGRGYLREPALTAQKFVPNPFTEVPGRRLYLTGDLARHRPDGNLEFLNRNDEQIKLRGNRIEPGEIEAVIRQIPAVREAAVALRTDRNGHSLLVAYVVAMSDPNAEEDQIRKQMAERMPDYLVPTVHAVTANEIKRYLRERLPAHMVPTQVVFIPEMPRSRSGKIDRRALPAPEITDAEAGVEKKAPGTREEKLLADIWASVLRLDEVGVNENFFDLGGDSIQGMLIVAAANQAGLQLAPHQLFERQTIAELAAAAGTAPPPEAEQGVVIGGVPLTPAQHWFFEKNLPDMGHFNQAVILELDNHIGPDVIKQAVARLMTQHDALRLRFVKDEAGWRQFNAGVDDLIPVSFLDLSLLSSDPWTREIEKAAQEAQRSLDLMNGPLLRVVLFDLGAAERRRLLIVIHHLAVDGVSWRILLEDLQNILSQNNNRETIRLPKKTSSFKQWAESIQRHLAEGGWKDEADYWLELTVQKTDSLPCDYTDGANLVSTEQIAVRKLTSRQTQALIDRAHSEHRTQVNEALLAALAFALSSRAGARRLLVDVEGHGRDAIQAGLDVSRTVGWFTSIYPILLTLDRDLTPVEWLKRVKELLRRIPSHGVGYGMLRYLSSDKEIRENLADIRPELAFNYLGQFDHLLEAGEIIKAAKESVGSIRSLRAERIYSLEVIAGINGGRMQIAWCYSKNRFSRRTIEILADRQFEALETLISPQTQDQIAAYTPSDFPAARLSQKDLDRFLNKITRRDLVADSDRN
jgi:amino acid adenylation domain-containing protein/non-ribosomal peptide synthase protein (TIGR01720 family)